MRKIWYAISHHSGAASTAAAIVWERVRRVSAEVMRMFIGTRTTAICNILGAPGSGTNLPCKASVQTMVSHRASAAATALHPSNRCREPRLVRAKACHRAKRIIATTRGLMTAPKTPANPRASDSCGFMIRVTPEKPVARPATCHLPFAWLIRQKVSFADGHDNVRLFTYNVLK